MLFAKFIMLKFNVSSYSDEYVFLNGKLCRKIDSAKNAKKE